jgi:hypothetical protein
MTPGDPPSGQSAETSLHGNGKVFEAQGATGMSRRMQGEGAEMVVDRFLKILEYASLLKPTAERRETIWMPWRTQGEGVTMEGNPFLKILQLTGLLKTSS